MGDPLILAWSREEGARAVLKALRRCCAPAKRCSAVPGGPREETRLPQMKLQNYHNAMFKCTKMLIQPLQPSCDPQDNAICWQVDQMGHTSQQLPSGPVGLATIIGTAGRERLDLICSFPSKVLASTLSEGNSRRASAKQVVFSTRRSKVARSTFGDV